MSALDSTCATGPNAVDGSLASSVAVRSMKCTSPAKARVRSAAEPGSDEAGAAVERGAAENTGSGPPEAGAEPQPASTSSAHNIAAPAAVLGYLRLRGSRTVEELSRVPDELVARELLRLNNHALYVSCWHINDDESAAMWTVYLGGREGVALQTTVGALRAELDRGS